jgi:ATP-dependent Lhr-like helicase
MTPFELLSEPVRKFIRNKGWDRLRPIQEAAIVKILASDDNYILASRTASGKTEAAFLPILSKVNFEEKGVQVLYIAPLIALINDQFYRIEELCRNLDITVVKWHGEANKTIKDRLIRQPDGITLITPESLEAMLVNKPHNVRKLFSNLKYVVIDEIHSFIGTDRGIQLKSILHRLQIINPKPFGIVGLSATIGDYAQAKKFTGNERKTKVLLDRTEKEITVLFRYFETEQEELPLNMLEDLYMETKDNKCLIFPNSRGRAEEIAVKLKKISGRAKGHPNYFSHHSSVNKEIREYVEHFAKNNRRQNFCISCTSTLELGIDIGTIDKIVQIDATHSISSLIQRVGRSGRKDGEPGNLCLYATDKWNLLQSLACWLLYKDRFIEPPQINEKPYDILLHQILSIIKGHSGIELTRLTDQLKDNYSFEGIETSEINQIINHLIRTDLLEKIRNEVIIGVEGEKVVNSRDFYSVFKTEENFKVVYSGNTIGEIPFSPQIIEDENLLLAARIWKIKYVDQETKKIDVKPARDGKKPVFYGRGAEIHPVVREKMFEILFSDANYDFLDRPGCDAIEMLRKDFSVFDVKDAKNERLLLQAENHLRFFTFTGTKINRTIQLLMNIAGINNTLDNETSSFKIGISGKELKAKWHTLTQSIPDMDTHIADLLQKNPALLDFSKFGGYLPEKYRASLLKDKYFDVRQTELFVDMIELIENKHSKKRNDQNVHINN